MVREALKGDLNQLLDLYIFLHKEDTFDKLEHLKDVWDYSQVNIVTNTSKDKKNRLNLGRFFISHIRLRNLVRLSIHLKLVMYQ